jgi:hypothetical protein
VWTRLLRVAGRLAQSPAAAAVIIPVTKVATHIGPSWAQLMPIIPAVEPLAPRAAAPPRPIAKGRNVHEPR